MTSNSSRQFSVVLADDHQIVRAGLRTLLETQGITKEDGLRVVGEATNGWETIEAVKVFRPDLLLLDISMPLASGAEILADIKRWSPDTKIVILTAVTSAGLLATLVQSGIDGLFAKGSDNSILFEKLPLILRGGKYIDEPLLDLVAQSAPTAELTQRERQSLNMIVSGRTNKEIADLMGISPKTAEKHRASLMQKLGVNSIAELMAKALRDGLIEEQRLL